jgi:hypothetical protein
MCPQAYPTQRIEGRVVDPLPIDAGDTHYQCRSAWFAQSVPLPLVRMSLS